MAKVSIVSDHANDDVCVPKRCGIQTNIGFGGIHTGTKKAVAFRKNSCSSAKDMTQIPKSTAAVRATRCFHGASPGRARARPPIAIVPRISSMSPPAIYATAVT